MADFSVISQSSEVRAIVQDGSLAREFKDALFPRMLFRQLDADPEGFMGNVGDNRVFTGKGLMDVDLTPLQPGIDPVPVTIPYEQWDLTIQQWARSIDTRMPDAAVAAANLFLENAHTLGLNAAQTLNRLVRNTAYNAALAGHTVADGAQTSTSTLRVKRLNGFTKARNPATAGASTVKFSPVSSSNPLAVTIFDNGVATAFNVIGFTPDNPGDEVGPGTLTLNNAVTSVADRGYVLASSRTFVQRIGGGLKVDTITNANILTLADSRAAISRMRDQNAPEFADGRYHAHLDAIMESQIFKDAEFQRLHQSLPDYYVYRDYAIGEALGCIFFRNNECPKADTVRGGSTAAFSAADPFGAECWSNGNASTGVKLHRAIFLAQGGLKEYWLDPSLYLSDAGLNGKVGQPQITNNGIEVPTDRIQLVFRAPVDRLQQVVSTSWAFTGGWVFRTDAASGDAAAYKRACVVEGGE